MRQVRFTRVIAGFLFGIGGHIFLQILWKTDSNIDIRGNAECNSPCEDLNKIRGNPCPFCGPHEVVIKEDISIPKAYKPKGMYEITRWYYYDTNFLYDIIDGEPKVNLTGGCHEETEVVTQVALEYINAHNMLGKQWYIDKLHSGYLRTDVFRGTDYILDIGVKSVEKHPSEILKKTFRVRMVHAFEEKEKSLKVISNNNEADVNVHIIALASGNEDTVERFIQNFAKQSSHNEKLTLVLFRGKGQFGEESLTLKYTAEEEIKKLPNLSINYIEVEGDYDFLQAITQAAAQVDRESIILTLSIDMYFGENLLEACRMIPFPGKTAYFPIAFSQYDPDIIERGMPPGKPKNINKMDINKFTGYWMHKKHNFICAYKNDLMPVLDRAVIAIESSPKTTNLILDDDGTVIYNYFLSDDVEVISAVEPDLIRIFRRRICSKRFMPEEEYEQCFRTAAEMLGSKPALSILYLTEIAMKKMR